MIIWKSELIRHRATTGIAVLPFENLSNDKEDASFADGVQDDILTKLAKVADLKVISRTSVMDIVISITRARSAMHWCISCAGRQCSQNRRLLHINAQLIDTRTDAHWAIIALKLPCFVIQEIAQSPAQQLQVKISAASDSLFSTHRLPI